MDEEVPVERIDLYALALISTVGGILIAVWMMPLAITPEFFVAIFVSSMLIAFFIFIPIMGARLFIDDWRAES